MDLEKRWKKNGKRRNERGQGKGWRPGHGIVDDDGGGRCSVESSRCLALA